ncbi:hypothetical protein [Novispirillum itersonii]|uniref:DUF2946 domain-containing protein n=1 Tax=Novispirillum itersonii TaxID=189 RepID=A0A7X0DL39_NOVIT|nr:hypothetical protein [Novispirillum itersonii]MBB6208759.1 hypothetical protein [Novispirillum itersonii]
MRLLRFPFTAIVRLATQPAMVRRLLMVLAVTGLLFNSGMMGAAAMAVPALSSQPDPAVETMACCDHSDQGQGQGQGQGTAAGVLKAGLMSCPVACGGLPVQALALPGPVAPVQRLVLPAQTRPDGLAIQPAYRPPILSV